MKNYLRIIALVLALVACASLVACGGDAATADTTLPADGDVSSLPIDDDAFEGQEGDTYSAMDYYAEDLSKYVTLGQYKGLEVIAPRHIVTDAEVENEVYNLIDAYTTYEPYDPKVTDRETIAGDFVNISYVGYIDGEPFEGGTADGDSVVLAENNGYIDWFEDDLYGIMPGTTVTSVGYFPENYHEHLAGKEVTFVITLNYIAGHYTIPEFNDELVKEAIGLETTEECRAFLREWLQAQSDASYDTEKYSIMWKQILDGVEVVELPESQVLYYYTSERSAYEMYAMQNGMTYEDILSYIGVTDEYLRQVMCDRVEEEIVFYSIVKAEGIEVTDEDYAAGLAEYAASQEMTEAALVENYGEDYIRECVLWDKMMYTLGELNTFVE